MIDFLQRITDKDVLQDNLTFVSLYIAVYEHMTDYVVTNIRDFLCDTGIKDGQEYCIETPVYKTEIKKRIVDEKKNRDVTKASFLWLIDQGAISTQDYSKFLQIKEIRNRYAHQLTSVIYQGITEQEVSMFFDMYSLYQRISKWFFLNIEAVIMGYELPDESDLESVKTTAEIAFGMILNVLYNGKSKTYKAMLTQHTDEG